ncbi:hypothetical protein [Adhaeribacter rhizoryzae]|uniref:Uncharacterized protein n=1 Tax=Adhaeribacter rhizoryzae TaxID=2607907 RepID=A0A5M6DHV0_9BACT|nr:hypothetical protein [Adhaeribacter rhizoryzae]KAA5544855.1 hypothetical protein F0145_14330 [Adhaeribacter rhizoryzae]
MNTKSLPGWTTKVEEVANGVFKIKLTKNFGRKAEIVDNATDETIDKTLSYAFDIERSVSSNWNKFLFEFCLLRLTGKTITKESYYDKDFDSWLIEVGNKRLLYLGKESWLVSQTQDDNEWFDNYIIKDSEITYETVSLFLKHMT